MELFENALRAVQNPQRQGINTAGCMLPLIILGCVGIFLIGLFATKRVDAGEVCVKTRFGNTAGVVEPGLHFRIPGIDNFHCYSQRTVVYEVSSEPSQSDADYTDFSASFNTPDGQEALANYTILWNVSADNAECAYQNTGKNMEEVNRRSVKAVSRSRVRLLASRYSAQQLFSGQLDPGVEIDLTDENYETVLELLQREIENDLTPRFAEQCVTLEQFLLRKFSFSDDFVAAQEQRAAAEAESERKAILADGDAQAARTRADAQAYSLQVVADTLGNYSTETAQQLVQLQFMDEFGGLITWGIVPEGVNPFIEIPATEATTNRSSED